jgi:hypothetical protein
MCEDVREIRASRPPSPALPPRSGARESGDCRGSEFLSAIANASSPERDSEAVTALSSGGASELGDRNHRVPSA